MIPDVTTRRKISGNFHICCMCDQEKMWYHFKFPLFKDEKIICLKCKEKKKTNTQRLKQFFLERRIEKLMDKAMSNKMSDLRNHLFETLEMVKTDQLKVEKAKTICEIEQTIINSAKVEIDFLKAINAKQGGQFFELPEEIKP